ncbi:OprD family outer membrane porin [Shivajiella indica]|uniref:OprD family outer membrane porin n=1 Tax=Shivajiella indica TaxID=872115 RepID=A0ABW5BBF7_9BACT
MRLLIIVILFGSSFTAFAGEIYLIENDSLLLQKKSLGEELKSGKVDFHIRSFFMSTINKGELLDYATLAAGAGIGYTSPEWKGFEARFSGFFTFQVFENNIRIADPTTGAGNRYEILLYDMNDLSNTNRLDRLEELYIAYRKNRLKFTLGRQKIITPLLNEQDNRMRPNVFGGLSAIYSGFNYKVTAMWINSVTIRGTVDWYSIEDSYGVYPFGRNPFGEPSGYKDNISSKGIGMFGFQYHKSGLTAQAWNYHADNVFNMSFAQSDYSFNIGGSTNLHFGVQGFYQFAINDGGNPDRTKTYILPEEKGFGGGSKVGIFSGRHYVYLNFLGISDKGRLLFPREWGRETFYASLSRERYEGSGDMQAWVLKYDLITPLDGLFAQFGAGSVHHSDMNTFKTNKYGIPSYYQFSGMLDFKFKDFLEGLNLQLLVINKKAKNNDLPDQLKINRVDMWNLNLVMDYRF